MLTFFTVSFFGSVVAVVSGLVVPGVVSGFTAGLVVLGVVVVPGLVSGVSGVVLFEIVFV